MPLTQGILYRPMGLFHSTAFTRVSRLLAVLLACWGVSACASIPVFPPKATDGIDEAFDFDVWRKTPNTRMDRKIELAGRIVRADARNGETFVLAEQLPVVDDLVYETLVLKRHLADYGVSYRATIDPKWLTAGNLFLVIGKITHPKKVTLSGGEQTLPWLIGECLHLWRTTGKELPQSRQNDADRLAPFEHMTYCASSY